MTNPMTPGPERAAKRICKYIDEILGADTLKDERMALLLATIITEETAKDTAELVEALEFYADKDHVGLPHAGRYLEGFDHHQDRSTQSVISKDGGERARTVLARYKEKL